MTKQEAAALSSSDRVRMSFGFSFRAKSVTKKAQVSSHTHGGRSQAFRGFECDQPNGNYPTKIVPGWAKVSMPRNHVRYVRPASEPRRGPTT